MFLGENDAVKVGGLGKAVHIRGSVRGELFTHYTSDYTSRSYLATDVDYRVHTIMGACVRRVK